MDDAPVITPANKATSSLEHAAAMAPYIAEGTKRASAAGNRGPLQLDTSGKLHPDILNAYNQKGFYIFEGVIGAEELDSLRADVTNMIDRAPVQPGAKVDTKGRPAMGLDHAAEPYSFIKPLSDPFGGTGLLNGRHPVQMIQPEPEDDVPNDVLFLLRDICQAMPACLRLYGNPQLLGIAEAVNGPDFVPYTEVIFVKQAGRGGAVSWHQDGVTHWQSPNWNLGIHGFNFQVQLYDTTPANGLWIVPGSHKLGHIDIKKRVEDNGGERLPDAIPLICAPGDVTIVNRQMLHGSFANTSLDQRISITIGFHRRGSVLGQRSALAIEGGDIYDEQRIFERSAVIAVAIDARAQYFPNETRYCYEPFVGLEEDYRWNDDTFERVIRNYSSRDLAI
jgi:hypothetical protein